jgi:hypothetical protein
MIGTVGARKVKKKETYYRKPMTSSSSTSSTANNNQQQQQLSVGWSSMTTLASLRSTGSAGSSPSVTVDINESSSTLSVHTNQGYSGQISPSPLPSPHLEVLVPIQPSKNQAESHEEQQKNTLDISI